MYPYPFSTMERYWLLAIRLLWQYRSHGRSVVQLVDRLLRQAGQAPRGAAFATLMTTLERQGADHLYIERFDQPGLTGDERDLLTLLRACYLDDPMGAEAALSALLPPGHTEPVIQCAQRVTAPRSRSASTAAGIELEQPVFWAACH
jgi:hypothetical protein